MRSWTFRHKNFSVTKIDTQMSTKKKSWNLDLPWIKNRDMMSKLIKEDYTFFAEVSTTRLHADLQIPHMESLLAQQSSCDSERRHFFRDVDSGGHITRWQSIVALGNRRVRASYRLREARVDEVINMHIPWPKHLRNQKMNGPLQTWRIWTSWKAKWKRLNAFWCFGQWVMVKLTVLTAITHLWQKSEGDGVKEDSSQRSSLAVSRMNQQCVSW